VNSFGEAYNEKEAQEILRRAAALQTSGAMSKDELVRAAAELGISPEAVEEGERQYREARAEEDLKSQFRAKRRQEFLESFKVLAACGFIFYLMMRDGWEVNSTQHNVFASVILIFGVWTTLKNGFYAFAEGSHGWQKSFQEFKATDAKRKQRASSQANDRVISDILIQTSPDRKLEVIKTLRESTGLPLNEAKNAVDDYYRRHPEIIRQQF